MNILVNFNFKSSKVLSGKFITQYGQTRVLASVLNRKPLKNNLPAIHTQKNSLIPWIPIRHLDNRPKFHADIPHPNYEKYRRDKYKNILLTKWGSGEEKPTLSYFVTVTAGIALLYATKANLIYMAESMAAAKDVLALATIEVDISKIIPGGCQTFKWRGKPLFVKNRTQNEIDAEIDVPASELRHPETQDQRCQKPEWLIVIGICTHLGCVPIPNSGDWAGGFYCPCHGSHYDNVGRIRKGPAPTNLEVPPYKFTGETVILVG